MASLTTTRRKNTHYVLQPKPSEPIKYSSEHLRSLTVLMVKLGVDSAAEDRVCRGYMDSIAKVVGIRRTPGEQDSALLGRVQAAYAARPYSKMAPLFALLHCLGFKHTKWFFKS